MNALEQTDLGVRLLREGRSDEEVERLTGFSLLRIIELRMDAATAPASEGGSQEASRRRSLRRP